MVVWFGFVHHLSKGGESFLQRYNKDVLNYSIYQIGRCAGIGMPFTRRGGQQISPMMICSDNITVDSNQEESGLLSRILHKFPKFLFYLFAELVCQRFAGQFAGRFVNVEVETVISLSIAFFILKRSRTHFVSPILIHQINLILCRATSLVPLQMQRFSVLRIIVKVDIQIAPEYGIDFVAIIVFYTYLLVLACQKFYFSTTRSDICRGSHSTT